MCRSRERYACTIEANESGKIWPKHSPPPPKPPSPKPGQTQGPKRQQTRSKRQRRQAHQAPDDRLHLLQGHARVAPPPRRRTRRAQAPLRRSPRPLEPARPPALAHLLHRRPPPGLRHGPLAHLLLRRRPQRDDGRAHGHPPRRLPRSREQLHLHDQALALPHRPRARRPARLARRHPPRRTEVHLHLSLLEDTRLVSAACAESASA